MTSQGVYTARVSNGSRPLCLGLRAATVRMHHSAHEGYVAENLAVHLLRLEGSQSTAEYDGVQDACRDRHA